MEVTAGMRGRGAGAMVALMAAWFFISSAPCPGQAATQAGAPSAASYRIAGRVVNASTGEPVRRATVAALGEADGQVVESAQTDAEGRFALEHLPAGKYPLSASRRGFRMSFYDEHDEYNSAIVTGPGQDTSNLVFRLTPGAVLHGVVTGDGGDAVENASVVLFKREHGMHSSDAEDIHQADGTTTDDTGSYEFSNLQAGEYYVAVIASPWYAMHPPLRRAGSGEDSPLDVAYPVTFFDSTTDEASATPIRMEPGGRQEADISLHAVPALRLQVAAPRKGAGIVQPELRTMVFGTQVVAEGGGVGDPHTGVVEFSGVAPGHYELVQGDPPRVSELEAASSGAVDPNAGSPAVAVTGRLRTTTGAPVPGNVSVELDPIGGQNRTGMQSIARRGEFRFDAVAGGTWSIAAGVQGNVLPVVAVAAAGTVTPGNLIVVKDHSIAIVASISSSLSRVQGFARADGKGVAGAMIVLVPRQPSAYRALVRRDQSDSDGSFSLRDVPAGQYTVIAIQDGWKLDWTDREAMTRYLSLGVPVTVPEQAGGVVRLPGSIPVQ